MVYDVTQQETFTNLSDIWAKESTNQDSIKMVVGKKVDKESKRVISKREGIDFAREYGCLFIECSAKTRVNVEQCFEELVFKILETPSLLAEGLSGVKKNIFKQKPSQKQRSNKWLLPMVIYHQHVIQTTLQVTICFSFFPSSSSGEKQNTKTNQKTTTSLQLPIHI